MDPDGFTRSEVVSPSSATRSEKNAVIVDVADGLAVFLAGLAADVVDEHEPFTERRREREGEEGSHEHVYDPENSCLGTSSGRSSVGLAHEA